jgi:uncharacterized membrane protein (DUF485 family)
MNIDHAIAKNARLGLVLFFFYLLFYGTFVYLSAFNGDFMARQVFAGVNVAIVYGFALIIVAIVLALIYLQSCHPERPVSHEGEER